MIISVTCLLITLVTYFLFNELRTQPDINNLGQVISLIITQVLFQFGKEQHAYVPSSACALIGALRHFFWLLVIFPMNVCCWHMFRPLTNMPAKSFKQSYVLKTCVYTVYAVVGSLLFEAINIIVTVVYTENADVGYGDGSCYISMRVMVGYTFALPVFLIILANHVMFCIVVFKMKRNSTVQNSAESKRNYLKIFAKLSTLTGLSWIFGFIYTYTEIPVFVYLFIILSNGQGVFIFISFVGSKRVLNLYKIKYVPSHWREEIYNWRHYLHEQNAFQRL
ncbi:adhesion G protein-coupled receptor L1-like [Dreissena polymorpha]|uniref:adhesion G protein-coupled receptor L1-like n=1 Tax=Dreissena polymorpha TaxID=45954 RepID=UPI002264ADF6|nr:adhesion G protein-coupled receptor L1-like [Dreissena polymorpha]